MMSCSTGAIVVVEQRGELAVEELDGIFCTGEVAFDVGTEWVEDNQVATVTRVPSHKKHVSARRQASYNTLPVAGQNGST
jgi:hypothetical protein